MVKSPMLFQVISLFIIHTAQGLHVDDMRATIGHRMSSGPSLRVLQQYDGANQYDGQSPTSYEEAIRMSTYGCDPYNEDCSQRGGMSPSPSEVEGQQQDNGGQIIQWEDVSNGNSSPSPMTYEPIALNGIDCNLIDALSCDVDALLAFKSAIVSEQDIFSSWIGDDPCEWRYIQCTSIDGRSNRVTKVNLDFTGSNFDNTLSGTLVKEISKMRYLTEFILTNQECITGQLYPEYSVLNKLVSFRNWRTDVYGTLPSEYSTWTNLEDFSCSYNTISGTLPPEYSTWVMLRNIYVGVNNIKGAIPFQYSTWSSIVNFDASQNQLSGSLPPFFSSWTQCCDDFNLNFNSLSGTLPVEYSLMVEMVEFKVAQNSISGSLPAEYSAWVKCCGRFYLHSNELTGTLPPEYSTMSRMELFAIDDNNLSGRLPVDYSTMINIDLFHANDNFFTGNTPDEWSTWSNDVEIWL